MRIAAGEFAKAALARIPVRTGFVAGAFGNLEALMGSQARLNPIVSFVRKSMEAARRFISNESTEGPKRFGNQRKFQEGEYYYPGGGAKILKTPTSGLQFATPIEDMFVHEGTVYAFKFEVDISYFNLQDVNTGNSPTAPWGAFEAGREAYIDYITTVAIPGMPKITQFIKYRTKRV